MNLDISYYVSAFLRRIYVMVIVAVGMTAAAAYVAMELPPTYRADARLLVEAPQIPTNLAASTVQVGTAEQLQIIQQRLLTRENLLEIARQFRVFPDLERMSANEIVQEMQAATRISQSGGRSAATMMNVAFSGDSGQKAAAVVNEYVTRILEANRSLRTQLAEETQEFFQQEADRLSEELARRSAAIVAFKREHSDALPTSLNFRQDRQSSLQERLAQIQRELETLDEQDERLNEIFASGGNLPGGEQTSDAQRLARLNADLESALAIYSSTNPRVRLLEQQIKQIKDRILASSEGTEDPRKTMLDMQLAEIDTRRQDLLDQRALIEQELQRLAESIARTPEVSVALDSLEREYSNIQQQYNQAASRLATAATGERIELLSKGERISVIERASVPNRPTSPNRPAIIGAGAIAGIGIGSALIFLMEFLNQSIRRPVDLERQLGLTPIATLPYIRTRREMIWKRLILIGLIAFVVIGGPTMIYLIHTYVMPIDSIVQQIVSRVAG